MRRHLLERMAQSIAEVAGEAGLERRQVRPRLYAVALTQFPDCPKWVAVDACTIQAHSGSVGLQPCKGIDPEEGIAAKAFILQRTVEQHQTGAVREGAAPGSGIGRQFLGRQFLGYERGFHGAEASMRPGPRHSGSALAGRAGVASGSGRGPD